MREAENVTQALSAAEEAQNAAEEAVTNAQGNIDQARKDLSQVSQSYLLKNCYTVTQPLSFLALH